MDVLRRSLEEIEYDPDNFTVGTDVHKHLFKAMSKVVFLLSLFYDALNSQCLTKFCIIFVDVCS